MQFLLLLPTPTTCVNTVVFLQEVGVKRVFVFLLFYYTGAVVALPDAVLCDNGFPTIVSGDADGDVVYGCTPYIQDKCENGYSKRVIHGAGANVIDGNCASNMPVQGVGIYVPSSLGNVLCDGGYYDGDVCVKYSENDELCPVGYRDIFTTNGILLAQFGTDCPTGTTVLDAYDGGHVPDERQMVVWSYPYTDAPDNMIALRMCAAGYEMNYLGNCAALCSVSGVRYLRTSTGVFAPVYDKKLTSPSLHLGLGNAKVCYVNLQPESATGAVNIKYNDALYHTVN